MEIASVAAASAKTEIATIYVALELSKSRWLVGIHTPLADKVSRYSVDGGDSAGLLDRIGRVREQAERRLERPVRVVCCYEAGYSGRTKRTADVPQRRTRTSRRSPRRCPQRSGVGSWGVGFGVRFDPVAAVVLSDPVFGR
jgi:hypothetical protein